MLPQELIRKKRDARALTAEEIAFLVRGMTDGSLADSQIGALAMAILLNGMDTDETVALTLAMRSSGSVLDWSHLPGPVVDKHSTGGVGDKVSLILAPLLAACGLFVPMISGRGLGHTGGTLDKLESIEGYAAHADRAILRRVVEATGCAIVGAGADLAPADRKLYAIRDVTATVESLPLITASILSKKLAAGPSALVMDVKTGSGAFMAQIDEARSLARSLVDVANGAGLPARALITDMNEVLGTTAGNALEVYETVRFLRGDERDPRLLEITLALGGILLDMAGMSDGRTRLETVLASGDAAERFSMMVAALGGVDVLDDPERLPTAPVMREVKATDGGHVARIDVRALGLAVIGLGGGRSRPDQAIDHAVGLSAVAGRGRQVARGDPLAFVHARDEAAADAAVETVRRAFVLSEAGPPALPVAIETVSAVTGA
ncbi:MAG: thymidine phosphorylase [Geminicoccaceae bacterium]